MTDMDADQICEQLVRDGVLRNFGHGRFELAEEPGYWLANAERAIADGNVALASWAAVEAADSTLEFRSIYGDFEIYRDEDGMPYESWQGQGLDASAITTASAMALAALEEGK